MELTKYEIKLLIDLINKNKIFEYEIVLQKLEDEFNNVKGDINMLTVKEKERFEHLRNKIPMGMSEDEHEELLKLYEKRGL
jgi:hypothetical protein